LFSHHVSDFKKSEMVWTTPPMGVTGQKVCGVRDHDLTRLGAEGISKTRRRSSQARGNARGDSSLELGGPKITPPARRVPGNIR